MAIVKLLAWLLLCLFSVGLKAQSNFVAAWNFDGNPNGNSDNPNIGVSSLSTNGVNIAGYPSNAISLQFWPTGGLSTGDYAEFSINAQNYQVNVVSMSFSANRSAQGPTQLAVRSSRDGFSSNIGTGGVGDNFSNYSFLLNYTAVEGELKFRIYGYGAASSNGTLRLDNLRLVGNVTLVPLPVEISLFKAQTFDNEVQLSWETAWERNASHFEVQRSADLKEFVTLHTLKANGDTRERSRYAFADIRPLPGINYYRLRQTDYDGAVDFSKIIAIVFESDKPQIWIFGNPATRNNVRIRLRQLRPSDLLLFNGLGQAMPYAWQSLGGDDYQLHLNLPSGYYWLGASNTRSQRLFLID